MTRALIPPEKKPVQTGLKIHHVEQVQALASFLEP
jgi:hypothetical protein